MKFKSWYYKVKPKPITLTPELIKDLLVRCGYSVEERNRPFNKYFPEPSTPLLIGTSVNRTSIFWSLHTNYNIFWKEVDSDNWVLRFRADIQWGTWEDDLRNAFDLKEVIACKFVKELSIRVPAVIDSPEEIVRIPTPTQLLKDPTMVNWTRQRKFLSEAKKEWVKYFEGIYELSRNRIAKKEEE